MKYRSDIGQVFSSIQKEIEAQRLNAMIFDPNSLFCHENECHYLVNGVPIFKDPAGHLTYRGSVMVAQAMLKQMHETHPDYLVFKQ